jgi:gamma-glutamyltranspeptidase / glutathione hydrolase
MGGVPGIMGVKPKAMIAACNPESAQAGLDTLKHGGNAMDAFVAATFADYVVAPGVTSLAGPLGLLVYDSASRRIEYLHAGLKRVAAPDGQYSRAQPSRGRAFLVPGAVAGLEAAHNRHGSLAWRSVLAPAIGLARDGFPIPPLYALQLSFRSAVLERNDYARQTFFKDGKMLKVGDLVRQPLLAQTLEGIADGGGSYFYQGRFSRQFVDAVNARGGRLTLQDLSSYQPQWFKPIRVRYRGHDVFVPSAYSCGGAKLALALRLLENLDFERDLHWTQSSNTLIAMVRIYRMVEGLRWTHDWNQLHDPKLIRSHLSQRATTALWRGMPHLADLVPPQPAQPGSHSYHSVVVDERGNIVTGTNSIESLVWTDEPIFVGGIPLNDAGIIAHNGPPGSFVIEPLAPYIIEKEETPLFAGGTFASSMFPADMQVISNLIDFHMSPDKAVRMPRFGMYSFDVFKRTVDYTRNFLDPRFPQSLVKAAAAQGVLFDQAGVHGFVDTGMPVIIQMDPQRHRIMGMIYEHLAGYATGY